MQIPMPDYDKGEVLPIPISHDPAVYEVGPLKFWALGDRVLIREDEFKSGYECPRCGGRRKIDCPDCTGGVSSTGKKCSQCEGEGSITCPDCGGRGGIIVTPEVTQRRPTSGVIVSAGADCKHLTEGQSVLYSSFAGYVVDLNRAGEKVTLRILHETEILAGMEGQFTLTNLMGKSEIALSSP